MSFIKKKLLTKEQELVLLKHHTSPFTPDNPKLEMYGSQLLFVTDEWMSDRRQNFVINEQGAWKELTGFTRYHFRFLIDQGLAYLPMSIPIPLEDEKGFKIKGEIVSIPPNAFTKLDKLKQNGRMFFRKRVPILVPHRDEITFENTTEERGPHATLTGGIDWMSGKFPHGHPLGGKKHWIGPEMISIVKAWMYIGSPDWWKTIHRNPEQFSEVPRFTPKKDKKWLTEYYRYQNPKE